MCPGASALRGPQQAGLHRHLAGQGKAEQPGHLTVVESGAVGSAHHDPEVAQHHAHRRRHPARRRDGPQLGGDDEEPDVELREDLGDPVVDPAGQVDDDRAAPSPGRREHRSNGLRRYRDAVAPVPAQHPQRMQLGQRLLQCTAADPPSRCRERRPPQPLGRLTAEQDVEAAAQGSASTRRLRNPPARR